jgi:hypothetical protein
MSGHCDSAADCHRHKESNADLEQDAADDLAGARLEYRFGEEKG